MGFVQIDHVTCGEVLERYISKTVFRLLVNEIGRDIHRDEKIIEVVHKVFSMVIASGVHIYVGNNIHGRTFYSEMTDEERESALSSMTEAILHGDNETAFVCFDREDLLRAIPQLQEEYQEPDIPGDPYSRFVTNLDNLDFRKLFPEYMSALEGEKAEEVDKDARVAELEQELTACRDTKQRENVAPKARRSYLTVIAALCNKSQRLDITGSSAVSIIQAEIEKIGLKLGDDTVRRIVKEVRDIMNE